MNDPGLLELRAATAEDMHRLGALLGCLMERGDVVGLIGPLGSGKTTFAQGLAAGIGVPPDRHVASPTFALVNEHPGGRIPFVHADLYRISSAAELEELGLSEAFDRGVAAIEWVDRFPRIAPQDLLQIDLSVENGGVRRVRVHASGTRSAILLEAWRRAASRDA